MHRTNVLERIGVAASWRATRCVARTWSAEGWGSRLSRRRARRSCSGGRSGQQEGGVVGNLNRGRKIRRWLRDDKNLEVRTNRYGVRHLWMSVILGIVRGADLYADEGMYGRSHAGEFRLVVVALVLAVLVEAVMSVSVCERQAGGIEAHQHGKQKSGNARERRTAHGEECSAEMGYGEIRRAADGCAGGSSRTRGSGRVFRSYCSNARR
jgi:hypothetical protein